MTDRNFRNGCAWRWAASIPVAVVSTALAFGCSAPTAVGTHRPPSPGPCEVIEYTTGYAKPVAQTVYGWDGARRTWQEDGSGSRDTYIYFADGTVLIPADNPHGFYLRAPRGPIDHQWRLHAETAAAARAMYTTDDQGRVTSVRAPRYAYQLDSAGRVQEVKVDCGTTQRGVQWLRNPDGKVREVLIDMGSGLTDTRLVYEWEGGQKRRARILRRGQGRTEASPHMVWECTPWLGAGRGGYETPAPADVDSFIELGQTQYTYGAHGRVTREASTHITAVDQTQVHHYNRDGNRIQTDFEVDGRPKRTTRYTYDCWR